MRRPRYPGRNPRAFHQKYKELQPERYAAEVDKVLRAGKTPAGMHRSILLDEVLDSNPGLRSRIAKRGWLLDDQAQVQCGRGNGARGEAQGADAAPEAGAVRTYDGKPRSARP